MQVDKSEILRYLGYRTQTPDEVVEQKIDDCIHTLEQQTEPKSIYRAFDLECLEPDKLWIADASIDSRDLSKNLIGCEKVYLMAATLGLGVDRLIARASAVRISDAVIYQAAAAAMIEAYCNEVNEAVRKKAELLGLYCRPRFSPGYGDFSIMHQRDFSRLLDTPRKIGLTVTESMLLVPIKSVTAVIGLSQKLTRCQQKDCEACGKMDCIYRR